MVPVVTKVVVVYKLAVRCFHNLAQLTFPLVFCFTRMEVIFARYPVSLALDHEFVEVRVLPAHDALQDSMELGKRSVTLHLHTPPDVGLRAPEGHFDFVNFDVLSHFFTFGGKPDLRSGLPVHLGKWRRLPRGGLGFADLGDNAKLLHKSQSVPVNPAFHHLATREACDAYSRDGELLPRRRNSAEIPFMSTSAGPTDRHSFAFCNGVLDRHPEILKGCAIVGRSLLLTLRTSSDFGRGGVMVNVIGDKQLVCHCQIALVPDFFDQTT